MENPYRLNLSKYSTHNIILGNIGENKNVLDIGCNDGYIGKLSSGTNRFYGLDYSVRSVEKTKKIYSDVLLYDLNNLIDLPWDIRFDVILFGDVLEHVLYPSVVLNFFVKNYLKNGGKLIISLPNIANWQIRLNLLFGKFNYTDVGILDKTHLHFFTFKSAELLATENCLRIIENFGGASLFGPVVRGIPFLKNLLSTSIIIICQKI